MSEKLFVAGISWSTTDDALQKCFSQFGEVVECQVMREPSGRSRGFGFVSFKDEAIKEKVLTQQLQLDGRKLDIKPAVSKENMKNQATDIAQDNKKIWVAGLSWETTDDAMFNFFARYGEIEKASIMKDKMTSKSRGFGFVTFVLQETVDEVLKLKDLELDGRKIECKLAVGKGGITKATHPKKVFVAGLLDTTSEDVFKSYFAEFGTITEASLQKDKSGKSRGFGFVTFETESSAAKAMDAEHNVEGKKVDVKAAVPRNPIPTPRAGGQMWMGGMGAAMGMRMAAAREFQYQQAQQAQQAHAHAAFAAASARAQPVQAAQAYGGTCACVFLFCPSFRFFLSCV